MDTAVFSIEDCEGMLEAIAELADPQYLASIHEARAQYQTGEVDALQDLRDIAHGDKESITDEERSRCRRF
jgi:hypothetical protein